MSLLLYSIGQGGISPPRFKGEGHSPHLLMGGRQAQVIEEQCDKRRCGCSPRAAPAAICGKYHLPQGSSLPHPFSLSHQPRLTLLPAALSPNPLCRVQGIPRRLRNCPTLSLYGSKQNPATETLRGRACSMGRTEAGGGGVHEAPTPAQSREDSLLIYCCVRPKPSSLKQHLLSHSSVGQSRNWLSRVAVGSCSFWLRVLMRLK